MTSNQPLVYACAGCSAAGRAAYDVAQHLAAGGLAEMSCLAGVAAEIPYFLKQLQDRPVWIVDGCPLQCAARVFQKQQREIAVHFRLDAHGVKKNTGLIEGTSIEQLVQELVTNPPQPEDEAGLCE